MQIWGGGSTRLLGTWTVRVGFWVAPKVGAYGSGSLGSELNLNP